MRFFLVVICCFSAFACAAAYKWVDEDGVVHYSNQPQEGAEELKLITQEMLGLASKPVPRQIDRSGLRERKRMQKAANEAIKKRQNNKKENSK